MFYIIKLNQINFAFKENIPEQGKNMWPKHVGSKDVYNKMWNAYTVGSLLQ